MAEDSLELPDVTQLLRLEFRALAELKACSDLAGYQAWNTRYLGRNGELTQAIKKLGTLPENERPLYGQAVKRVKDGLIKAHETALVNLKEKQLQQSLAAEALDVTLPGRPVSRGRLHPSTQTL